MPQLCETVTAADPRALVEAYRLAERRADLVELRLDALERPEAGLVRTLATRSGRLLVTCRPSWEGGEFRGAEEDRARLLEGALEAGADYVDVEWRAPWRDRILARHAARTVVSWHNFERVPANLDEIAAGMSAGPAAFVKIAVAVHALADLLPLLELGRRYGATRRLVVVGMGEAGQPSRILAARFGSAWSYAGAAAPGQLSAVRMLDEFRFRDLTDRTRVFGVAGRPIAHSVSPAMHNAAFDAAGLDAVYVPLAATDLDDLLAVAGPLGIEGVSVTAPFKRDALAAAADRSAIAIATGAANTLKRTAAGWAADNTDVAGFLAPLAERVPLDGLRVAVVGAGGAARAAIHGLLGRGARVTVYARRHEAAVALGEELEVAAAPFPPPAGDWDVLVNATSAGTWPAVDDSPVPSASLAAGGLVYDLVYNPRETRLLRDARAAGCDTLGGLPMLVAQAARQFAWWTGVRPDEDVMRHAAEARLAAMAAEAAPAAETV